MFADIRKPRIGSILSVEKLVKLDPQVLGRKKMLEDIGDNRVFRFHSISNGGPVKVVK